MHTAPDIDTEVRISWFRVFGELSGRGWNLYRIAEEFDINRTTMLGWKAGASPKHEDGETIIRLWQIVTNKTRDELPTERRQRSASYYRRRLP